MQKIDQNNKFEVISLLVAGKGLLDVTMIPVARQFVDHENKVSGVPWLVPTNLILDVIECDTYTKEIVWNKQLLKVVSLLQAAQKPDKIVILEGASDKHRIALLTKGELKHHRIKITQAKDIDLIRNTSDDTDNQQNYIAQAVEVSFLDAQAKTFCHIPDLDELASSLYSVYR